MNGSGVVGAAVAIVVLQLVTWLVSLRVRDVSWVDVTWGLCFVAAALAALVLGDGDSGRRVLVAVLVAVWGLRLAGHLARRKAAHPGEDPRYTAMRERHERFGLVSLGLVFGLQGVLALIVALPLMAGDAGDGGLGALDVVGVLLWLVGFVFEAVGDEQLRRFLTDPDHGDVLDTGLWRLTRHPNYFGEFCLWWGLFLIALATGAWWAAVSPLVMTLLVTRVSGVAHQERASAARKPARQDYIERTSAFLPAPPRGSRR